MKNWILSFRIRTNTRTFTVATSVHYCPEGLAWAVRQDKGIKGIILERKGYNYLFTDDVALYIGNGKVTHTHIHN